MARRGHGEGSIYQRSDGRWAASISLEGGKRKTFYGKTRKAVQEQLKTALHQQQQGILATGPQQKVEQFLQHWLENVHKQSIRSRTYERYEEIVRLHLVRGSATTNCRNSPLSTSNHSTHRNWRKGFRQRR